MMYLSFKFDQSHNGAVVQPGYQGLWIIDEPTRLNETPSAGTASRAATSPAA